MAILQSIAAQFRPSPEDSSPEPSVKEKDSDVEDKAPADVPVHVADSNTAAGVAGIEAMQAIWGTKGRWILISGLALMMIIFELDNTTVYNYQTFATSSFSQLSKLSAISTAQTLVSAVIKPPIAKLSDVIGRGETYLLTISCYLLSYILCASSATVDVYAGGAMFYAVGQSGTQILDQIIIADISNQRWRGFAIGFSYFPFLITPWVSAFIVDSVVNGIGWRWGIGMFAILMPFCASFIVVTLIYFGRKSRKAGLVVKKRLTLYDYCSLIDLGGMILLLGGFVMLLLPFCLAATTPSQWKTAYLDALIGVGAVFLIALVPYEKYYAKHPVVPLRYFKNMTIVMSCLLSAFDAVGFACTHTYLYAWSIVTHNYSVRNATFLVYLNGVTQCLVGIGAGWIMYKMRRYKWMLVVGCAIRFVGYGVMMRLRGQENSMAELFVVQAVQGIGSGIVETIVLVSAQIVVPHAELAQISSLVLLIGFLGSAVGQSIAGGIYTNTFPARLHERLPNATDEEVKALINSITGVLPEWGTADRIAVNYAYSDVMRYITIVALAVSVPIMIFGLLLPDKRLGDAHNAAEGTDVAGRPVEAPTEK
ncbi:major facilitator superfamily domain-containing protein [Schizophyllum commune]